MKKISSVCVIALLFNTTWFVFEAIQREPKTARGQAIGGLTFEPLGKPRLTTVDKGVQPFHTFRFKPKVKSKQIVSMSISQDTMLDYISTSNGLKKESKVQKNVSVMNFSPQI
jgi:hypothetical protein